MAAKIALGSYNDEDFDQYGLLKPSHWLWLVVLLLMRGWLIFVMAGVSREHGSPILSQFYPQHGQLAVALLLGLPALVLAWTASLKQYRHTFSARYWRYGQPILLLSLLIDGLNQLVTIHHLWSQGEVVATWQPILLLTTVWAFIFMLKSQRSREAFAAHSAVDKASSKEKSESKP
ncbi:Inner membrane protein YfeZ [Vibrio stylophorae]|uniref:Inner membrane protein YfeZ n=1 Tax=Vibrio stylophorae TaxID=659351 RepID=A0ABM8ZV13_9VIBR|nr:DUF2919 family protein [Vibrio stylophorae]CAH0534165.1 Inner membrane protein YfeZ [Vibrio stylophorae]